MVERNESPDLIQNKIETYWATRFDFPGAITPENIDDFDLFSERARHACMNPILMPSRTHHDFEAYQDNPKKTLSEEMSRDFYAHGACYSMALTASRQISRSRNSSGT